MDDVPVDVVNDTGWLFLLLLLFSFGGVFEDGLKDYLLRLLLPRVLDTIVYHLLPLLLETIEFAVSFLPRYLFGSVLSWFVNFCELDGEGVDVGVFQNQVVLVLGLVPGGVECVDLVHSLLQLPQLFHVYFFDFKTPLFGIHKRKYLI